MEPEKLEAVIEQNNLLSVRCEKCGYGIRHKESDKLRKWCKRCITIYRRKQKLKPEQAEKTILKLVEPLYAFANFDDFTGRDIPIREKLLNLEPGRDLYLYGTVGTGKTYAMAALIRHYVYEGYNCARINFDDFCVEVRSTMSPASKITEWDMIKPFKEVDKLFIDDLGLRSTQETQFTYMTLYSILNKRQERKLPTLISSNKTIEQLGQTFDARIASRLRTAEVIELTGQDRRLGVAG